MPRRDIPPGPSIRLRIGILGGQTAPKEFILAEARRRLAAAPDSIPDTLKVWAGDLVEWLARTHPGALRVSARSAMHLSQQYSSGCQTPEISKTMNANTDAVGGRAVKA
jgi:hypothetical protein